MKKSLVLLFMMCCLFCTYAQPQTIMRYNYLGKIVVDKTQPKEISESVFVLDIDATNSSRFLEKDLLERKNAIAKATSKEEAQQIISTYRPKTYFTVLYANGTLTTNTIIQKTTYNYNDDKKMLVWQIEPGHKQWHTYTVQQATAFFEGRQWHVLFTSEIPLIEGPYKFKNLPGFVVKAWDTENQYEFEFLNSEKITIDNWNLSDPKEIITYITPAQYEKALKVYSGKTYRDILIEMNPKNAETVPAEFAEKIGLRSNPIYKVQ